MRTRRASSSINCNHSRPTMRHFLTFTQLWRRRRRRRPMAPLPHHQVAQHLRPLLNNPRGSKGFWLKWKNKESGWFLESASQCQMRPIKAVFRFWSATPKILDLQAQIHADFQFSKLLLGISLNFIFVYQEELIQLCYKRYENKSRN